MINKENAHLYLPYIQALAAGKDVDYRITLEAPWEKMSDLSFSSGPEHYRIMELPERVPLGVKDVPMGSVIWHGDWSDEAWEMVTGVSHTALETKNLYLGWSHLMADGYKIRRPGDGEWKSCSKLA